MRDHIEPGSQSLDVDDGEGTRYLLRLYVTGATSRSARAISNIRRICDKHLADAYDLEVIDIYLQPEAALEFQIVAAPTLVKVLPLPVRRIIGDHSDEARTLIALGIATPSVSGTAS